MPKIKFQELDLAAVAELDPLAAAMFKKIMRDLAKDCENRPYDTGARTCSLKFKMKPVPDNETRELDRILLEIEGTPSIPVYRTKPAQLRSDQGRLVFNVDIPDDIDQQPLFPSEDGADQS